MQKKNETLIPVLVDLNKIVVTSATLITTGAITWILPTQYQPYVLGVGTLILTIERSPIPRTPAALVEEAVRILEKVLQLLPSDQQANAIARVNAIKPQ